MIDQSLLRAAHLSPDAPAVDVWVDGSVVLSGVTFGTVSDYLMVSAGEHLVQLTVAGTTSPIGVMPSIG